MKFLAEDQIAEAIASEECILGIIERIWCISNNCHESLLLKTHIHTLENVQRIQILRPLNINYILNVISWNG